MRRRLGLGLQAKVPVIQVGNLVATLFIASWEGALDRERLQAVLAGQTATEPQPALQQPQPQPALASG
jgi:hypothetical protein